MLFRSAKAKWETSPEMQQAGLAHTQAQTGLYSAQTEEARQKTYFEQFKGWQDSQINFLQDSYAQAQGPGRASGGDIVMNMRARLENDIKTATSPQIQQLAQKRLQGFMEDPRISKIANMTNEEILAEIPKAIENIALKDPQYIRQKALDDAKNAVGLQEQRIIAGAKTAHDQQYEDFIKSYMLDHPTATRNEAHQAWNTSRYGSVQSIGIDPETGMVRKTETSPVPGRNSPQDPLGIRK